MNIDINNKKSFLVIGLLIIFAFAFIHWNGQILQYIFFLRIPLISGLLLFFLPVICIYLFPTMLGNLFVLSNALRMALVIPGSVVVGLGIVLIGSVIGANADERFSVDTVFWLEHLASKQSIVPYILAILLSLPTILAVYWSSGSASEEMSEESRRNGAVSGTILSILFLAVIYWFRTQSPFIDFASILKHMFLSLPESDRVGFLIKSSDGWSLTNGHLVMSGYMLVSTLLYFVGLVFYRPSIKKGAMQLPAISYVLGLLQIFSLLFGLLTFLFDFYRVPVMLSVLLFSALTYRLWKVDHYYEIKKSAHSPLADNDVIEALKKRLAGQDTLVVICAGGGGIQAAGWTAKVLTGLQEMLGESFTRAIGLISSVSGGSVGAMYFLDRFNDEGVAKSEQLEDIFSASTADSLGATGWGLAYPDMWRIVGMPYLKTKPRDRGDAIMNDWKSEMIHPSSTLNSWSTLIKKGLLPTPVFNATIVEDGRHYLISPVTFNLPVEQAVEFNSLYQGFDIDVSTAAILSATFPYITPITRNSIEPKNKPIYHVADGGFFDNFGVVTATHWLNRLVLPNHKALGIKRVLFVEIRAFHDKQPLNSGADKAVGWKMALFGPILTIVNARKSTQSQRNIDEVEDLKQNWNKENFEILTFPITFPKEDVKFFVTPKFKVGNATLVNWTAKLESEERKVKQYEPPLSWTLTKKQREDISTAWNNLANRSNSVVTDLEKAWKKG